MWACMSKSCTLDTSVLIVQAFGCLSSSFMVPLSLSLSLSLELSLSLSLFCLSFPLSLFLSQRNPPSQQALKAFCDCNIVTEFMIMVTKWWGMLSASSNPMVNVSLWASAAVHLVKLCCCCQGLLWGPTFDHCPLLVYSLVAASIASV